MTMIPETINMPVHKSYKNGRVVGWRWGRSGKVYATRAQAEKQARAIYASGYKG
jgi:hypothetical protein